MTTEAPPESPRAPEERIGLSRNAAGRAVPSAWARTRSRIASEDPAIGWAASIGVALLALFLRLWHLGQPHEFEFDETYYAKDAWSLINNGYVRSYVDNANEHILDGKISGQWKDEPSMIVHPEVGKWLIGLGEKAFGMDPFGWRVSAAVAGALMVLVMCRLARRLTGSTVLGVVAGLLLTVDGLHFVLSRLGLLDIFVALFILCGVHCVVADRDWYRRKMARLQPEQVTNDRSWGPVRGLFFRPWLLLAGISWGLACGSKWEAVYPLAAFGLMVWLWSAGARRSFGVRWSVPKSALADGVPAFLHLVVVALVVYVASWTGWLVHANQYEEHLSSTQYTRFVAEGKTCDDPEVLNDNRWPTATEPDASGLGEVWQSLRSLWYYHHDVYEFHTHFLNCSTHTYASNPAGWLVLNRPVGVAADTDIQPGTRGCEAPTGSTCLRQVLLLGNPTIWWGGCLALVFGLVMWIGARDWRYGLCLVGAVSTWLPWLQYDDRPIFSFYAIITLPFIVLALTLAIGTMIGPSSQPSRRRTIGVVVSGAFVVLAVLNFAWFWPIYTNQLLTHGEWLDRIWFTRWV
ncbi:dolichyl-phosphate-mannose--protein mannosyltransferase [Nocardioides mangrovi]|uniref:Polyprenol-phosphate-mannose--protein mannosyltransferase n=1 Tax=Nocardioides mangrovi TaxID=2874580 RepID=A0ABS7UA63_9ACTN|nr:phospholipid carrier-dependent glycosyltransferase [Nocardioides mangrovi]MBZ5737760.1 phospholipid carrier-dependent glycosyltransferase [Nocardioides mangrovi]